MNEFIKKLIERLEELEVQAYDKMDGGVTYQAYRNAIEIVIELAEEHKDNVMINGHYCWQTCGATEHCKECNRLCNGSIDCYENYDVLAEEYKPCNKPSCKDCEVYDKEKHYCPKWCEVIKHTASELAEEYNDGWITDRNPTREECGEYGHAEFQVTISQPERNKTITMDFVYETVRGKEVARWKWCDRLSVWEVLAWKHLDAPYQPKGE